MAAAWAQWEHVTKVDPDKALHGGDTYTGIADTGTDALIIGGTTNVTESSVQSILDALASTEIPIFVEPTYRPTQFHTEAFSGYLLPIVLNANDPLWITGAHYEWVRSSDLEWGSVHPEAYIVLNPASSVATYTQAGCDLETLLVFAIYLSMMSTQLTATPPSHHIRTRKALLICPSCEYESPPDRGWHVQERSAAASERPYSVYRCPKCDTVITVRQHFRRTAQAQW
ncbi:geranylgeranylglyceryl/heptaprenylglyceryl phosphate synthase [Haladaptatus pallidirubidus]|uniref:phosphoglycerol geranylgeranyltransferase n=1 Tax=Haladaptatus pallidirubidus TaxID=1008152 RepID=A0AAV3UPP0_9EURY|nr:geranylgeranylglyceryl/heptaprenylglyceryl phosphate synthase [Haladaptatus pallidirubidus]